MIPVKVFLHAEKESMWELGEELGLTGEALGRFRYTCYEVELDLEVDEKTGESAIVAVDGIKLGRKRRSGRR